MDPKVDDYLPKYVLDCLTDRVYNKIRSIYKEFAPNINSEVINACKIIDQNPQAVSSIIVDAKRRFTRNRGCGYEFCHYLSAVYIVLYYLHQERVEYNTIVFPQLKNNFGELMSKDAFIVGEINKIQEEEKLLKKQEKIKPSKVKVDYTKVSRMEVYHDRHSIDDFQIDTEGSIEKVMLEVIYKEKFFYDLPGAEKYILDIFNTAHYITTMILADPRPLLHFRFYVDTAEKIGAAPGADQNTYGRFFSSMALAMVVNYLRICDAQYCEEDNQLIKNMYLWHNDHFDESQWDGQARLLFFNNIQTNDVIEKARQYMSYDDFLPITSIANFERQVQALPNVKGDIDSKASHIHCIKEERDGTKTFSFYRDKPEDNNEKEWDKEMISSFFNEDGIPRQTTKEEWDELFGEGNWDKHFGNKPTSDPIPTTTIESNDTLLQQLAEAQKTIEDQNEEIENLNHKDGKISSKEAAILTITACYHGGGLPKNRENLHPIITSLFGIGETLAKRRLREGIKEKDAEKLAKLFDETTPKIARLIREMPEKLKNNK